MSLALKRGARVTLEPNLPNQPKRTGTIFHISGSPVKPYMIKLDSGSIIYTTADQLTVVEEL